MSRPYKNEFYEVKSYCYFRRATVHMKESRRSVLTHNTCLYLQHVSGVRWNSYDQILYSRYLLSR